MYHGLIIIKLSKRELGDEDGFLIIKIRCLIKIWNKIGCLVLWCSCGVLGTVLLWGKYLVFLVWIYGCGGWIITSFSSNVLVLSWFGILLAPGSLVGKDYVSWCLRRWDMKGIFWNSYCGFGFGYKGFHFVRVMIRELSAWIYVFPLEYTCLIGLAFLYISLRWVCWKLIDFVSYRVHLLCKGSRHASTWVYSNRGNLVCRNLENILKWFYGLTGIYYKNRQDSKTLRTSFYFHNLYAFFRANRERSINNKYMSIGITGFLNVGNMTLVCWLNGPNWRRKDSQEIDGDFMGLKRVLQGLRGFGIIRLLSIIKLRSSGSKERHKNFIYENIKLEL